MMDKYTIENLKKALDKHLENLKTSQFVYCMTAALAEKLLAYSRNFKIARSSLLDEDEYLTFNKISFKYLNTLHFLVEVYGNKCTLYPNLFTVHVFKDGYDLNSKISTDSVDEVFEWIINYAEGKGVDDV